MSLLKFRLKEIPLHIILVKSRLVSYYYQVKFVTKALIYIVLIGTSYGLSKITLHLKEKLGV